MLWNVGSTFGRPQDTIALSEYGTIIKHEIDHLGKIYDGVVGIDKYVIMPNHTHLFVAIEWAEPRPYLLL